MKLRVDVTVVNMAHLSHNIALCWFILLNFYIFLRTVSSESIGGLINIDKTLEGKSYQVTEELIVDKKATLKIEQGVMLEFSPGIGITVYGGLIAKGAPSNPILLTKMNKEYTNPTKQRKLRLVDANAVNEGRLQIWYNNKWRSVCTHSTNWTDVDINVACRDLGYMRGTFYQWFIRNNDSFPLMFERPQCKGSESALLECNQQYIRIGSGYCDEHMDIGIHCDGLQAPEGGVHWRGIRFIDAQFKTNSLYSNKYHWNQSLSSLEFMNIHYGGVDLEGNSASAIEAIGVPPILKNIVVKWSAFNAINFTHLNGEVDIEESSFTENRGHGIAINSTKGMVRIINVTVNQNLGDGIKYYFNDSFPQEKNNFCDQSSLGINQHYPTTITGKQNEETGLSPINIKCQRTFDTQSGHILTAHIIHFMGGNDTSGELEFRDGSLHDELIAIIPIRNNTRPQSISTTKNFLWIEFRAKALEKVEFTIEITTGLNKSYDVNISGSSIYNNSGKGIVIENMRSMVHIINSTVLLNGHMAGIHINGGAGDINITGCSIEQNHGDGINISYAGGKKNLTFNTITSNRGRGIALYFNSSQNQYELIQQTQIADTDFSHNLDVAVHVGNYCKDATVNISANAIFKNEDVGIEFVSCLNETKNHTWLIIGSNTIKENKGLGLKITPALNIIAEIANNSFSEHPNGVILIKNYDYEFTERHPTKLLIFRNKFFNNEGRFVVNIGLSEKSIIQELQFIKNELSKSSIKEPFSSLNSRNRASAVVVITSSNTLFQFNKLEDNEGSKYLIATHLDDAAATINATKNWWGVDDRKVVLNKVFDFSSRYNLAKILYTPLLVEPNVDSTLSSLYVEPYQKPFRINSELGGILNTPTEIGSGTYSVISDIVIIPPGNLRLINGANLEFIHGVGIMVQGSLDIIGNPGGNEVQFKLKGSHTRYNGTNLRITNGKTQFEGRIEIQLLGKWGTICKKGWTRQNAALVCNQLGMVLNAKDWYMDGNQFPSSPLTIFRSNVRCSDLDIDITICKAEGPEDHSCDHSMDIGVKCVLPTWAGIRYSINANKAIIQNAVIENSGVFDPNLALFSPALQLDWNKHQIFRLFIHDNQQTALEIIYNNPFLTPTISESIITKNAEHGIKTRSSGLRIKLCKITNNEDSGLHYNPAITRKEQKDLFSWFIKDASNVINIPSNNVPTKVELSVREEKYFIIQPTTVTDKSYSLVVEASSEFVLGIYLLNRPSNETSEEIFIYEGKITPESRRWNLIKDFFYLNDFPVITAASKVHIQYKSGSNALGNILFLVTAIPRADYYPTPPVILSLENVTIESNLRGISVRHYNIYTNEEGMLFLRCANESIRIVGSSIKSSIQEAIWIDTPYRDPMLQAVSEIEYVINDTLIMANHYGVYESRRDMRSSNNIFHWTLMRNYFMSNEEGGFSIRLPFIRNRTFPMSHTIVMENNIIENNRNFEFRVWGHYALFNMSGNVFKENRCRKGLILIGGMEKEMKIYNNSFMNNYGHYIIEFEMWSHTDKAGIVNGNFSYNTIKDNQYNELKNNQGLLNYPRSYAVGVRGLQRVNVTFNLLGNKMDYEILTGILTASLDNYLEVQFNWWGTNDVAEIRQRIFDFDDWNSYAIAKFVPFLNADSFTSSFYSPVSSAVVMDLENLGGRLTGLLRLFKRSGPYIVRSDLTVPPGILLYIDPGVELQFYPNTGILVLGELQAIGTDLEPIKMLPMTAVPPKRMRRDTPQFLNHDVALRYGNNSYEGFLEIYNVTTRQWVPTCDHFFTERNAEVICKELGFDYMDVYVWWGRRSYYVDLNQFRFWPEPLQCTGQEENYAQCELRQNGNENLFQCYNQDNFVFIKCGGLKPRENLYWGGIRFSLAKFEDISHVDKSVLHKVEIVGAGMLHNEKAAALQSILRSPRLEHVTVKNSAFHGVSIVAPQKTLELKNYTVQDNLGVGISIGVLTGESSIKDESNFIPLQNITLPYNIFGMVHICDANKNMYIDDRVLIYYKYDNYPVDCVKIFSSRIPVKTVGFRLLQFNLYNYSSQYDAIPDSIEVYDGNVYNETSNLKMSQFLANNSMERKFFKTTGPNMTVYLHASAADGIYGFIAEVVTLPIGVVESGHNVRCNVSSSLLKNNRRGAIRIYSAGEISPMITIDRCQIEGNGIQVYHNFTTSESAVSLDIQNTQYFDFINNMLYQNQGGLKIQVDSITTATRLQGKLLNNVFCENHNSPALHVEGKSPERYQLLDIEKNIFIHNHVPHSDVILFSQIVFKFKNNAVNNNSGLHIMHLHGFEKVKLTIPPTTEQNSFYMNVADGERYRSTVVVGSAAQNLLKNIFVNPDNDFELTTFNRSLLDVWDGRVRAIENWWGYGMETAVAGRIRDKSDAEELLEVNYKPFLISNETLLSGDCIPGWTNIGSSCFYYFGGYMDFNEAKDLCKNISASMPFAEGKESDFTDYVASNQYKFVQLDDAFWVQKKDAPFSACTAIRNEGIWELPCNNRLPFLCETNPVFNIQRTPLLAEITYIIVIVIVLLALLLIIFFIVCWVMKSRVRHEQALQRRNSIRSSVRSNRSTLSSAYSGKKLHPSSRNASSELSSMKYNGSVDSVGKSNLFDSSIEKEYSQDYHVFDTKDIIYTDLKDTYAKHTPLENDAIKATLNPTFDLTFVNDGYMDLTRSNSHSVTLQSSDESGNDLKEAFITYRPYKPKIPLNENMTINIKTPLETAM